MDAFLIKQVHNHHQPPKKLLLPTAYHNGIQELLARLVVCWE
jgi:hypothetical protein